MSRAIADDGLGPARGVPDQGGAVEAGEPGAVLLKHGGLKSLRPAGGHQFFHGRHDPGPVLRHNIFYGFPERGLIQAVLPPDLQPAPVPHDEVHLQIHHGDGVGGGIEQGAIARFALFEGLLRLLAGGDVNQSARPEQPAPLGICKDGGSADLAVGWSRLDSSQAPDCRTGDHLLIISNRFRPPRVDQVKRIAPMISSRPVSSLQAATCWLPEAPSGYPCRNQRSGMVSMKVRKSLRSPAGPPPPASGP